MKRIFNILDSILSYLLTVCFSISTVVALYIVKDTISIKYIELSERTHSSLFIEIILWGGYIYAVIMVVQYINRKRNKISRWKH